MKHRRPTLPSRPILVHSAFAAVFAFIAIFAWATAEGTTASWFSPDLSSQAYAASLIGAVVVAIALATATVSHLGRLEDARRGIALRIAEMPEADLLPTGEATLVASAAGAMLPGSDGFAASHFQLNTGLILFLGYGWMFLVLWAVLALAMLTARSSPDGQKMVRSGK